MIWLVLTSSDLLPCQQLVDRVYSVCEWEALGTGLVSVNKLVLLCRLVSRLSKESVLTLIFLYSESI